MNINKGDHVQDGGRTSRPHAVSALHNALADNVCPLETATAVKTEPPDVNDDVCFTDDMATVKNEAFKSGEVCFLEIDTTVKNESLTVNDNVEKRNIIDNVKIEGSDVRDRVCSLDSPARVKEEVEILPTVLQSPDIKFRIMPCKPDSENDSQMESHRLSNIIIKQDNPDVTNMCEVRYFCNVCSKNFILESDFQLHFLTHTGEDNQDLSNTNYPQKYLFEKKICNCSTSHCCYCDGTVVPKKICFNLHTHTGERPHRCSVCNKQFSGKRLVLACSGERLYHCDLCKQKFMKKSTEESHILTQSDERSHRCNICNKNFSHTGNFKRHLLTHTGEKPYRCAVCSKDFSLKGSLKKHMLTHTGERPHRCDICNKDFSRKCNLKEHMLTHTGERTHDCNICNKSFSLKSTLKNHMLTHTGERRHSCDICNKNFSLKNTLKNHMLTHTGDRRHRCDICNKNFSLKDTLKMHILTHTGERPHHCDVCNKDFSRKHNLKEHMLTHAGEITQ